MVDKEDLSRRGIEAGRTDISKRSIVDTLKRVLRGLYATASEYEEWAKRLIEGAIVASLTIPSGIDVLAGQMSVNVAYALVLAVLLVTVKLIDLSQRVWYLDGMPSRVEGVLTGGALITGVVAVAGFNSPTVAIVQSVAIVWAIIWLIAMYATMESVIERLAWVSRIGREARYRWL